MKKAYEAPEIEIEEFSLFDAKVFTLTPSHEGGIGGDDGMEEDW